MIKFEEFTGGALYTNAFLVRGPSGTVLVDAPPETDEQFAGEKIDAVLLTHGHFDHIGDLEAVRRRHGCPVYLHAVTEPMVREPQRFPIMGVVFPVEPFTGEVRLLAEGDVCEVAGLGFHVLEVPGHCPGSLCFHLPAERVLFGGDTLFRSGIGRWDLPGGDHELLVTGIRQKILTLPDATRVFPGHGPATTVAHERAANDWLNA